MRIGKVVQTPIAAADKPAVMPVCGVVICCCSASVDAPWRGATAAAGAAWPAAVRPAAAALCSAC
jgi:hypothetical protein